MTSASTTSARSLFVDSRNRLADRVQVNVNNIASIVRQIQRGSKSHELLMQSASQFVHQERAIENTENNIKKFPLIVTHLGYQQESIEESLSSLHHLKNQVNELQQLI
ncbi:BLOC-1-related complex subunit 7 [Planococcus citri]|uniref:BLOC-1-related complex subunit 7 n=1 Tax=Planococcus citri TaxID=170843 RepID=UPI0031FA367C